MEFKTWKVKTCTVYSLKDYIDVIANLKEDFKRIFNNDYGFDTNVNEKELNQNKLFQWQKLIKIFLKYLRQLISMEKLWLWRIINLSTFW